MTAVRVLLGALLVFWVICAVLIVHLFRHAALLDQQRADELALRRRQRARIATMRSREGQS